MSRHLAAIAQAMFVVFLWATSWVFIKVGLQGISPIIFAGLRYFLAFICLLTVLFVQRTQINIRNLSKPDWGRLLFLGLFYYAVTQGAIFVALAYLPAVTVNLLWSFSSSIVALLGIFWLSEKPSLLQWGGITLTIIGAMIFFLPISILPNQWVGVGIAGIGILANSFSSIMGRDINRTGKHPPLIVTTISMGAGSIALIVSGVLLEGIPTISTQGWWIILWLAVVNTTFAFILWNHTLRTLTAMESSIINGTMMIWIPILAILFLGETINGREVIGLLVTGIGTIIVQLRRSSPAKN